MHAPAGPVQNVPECNLISPSLNWVYLYHCELISQQPCLVQRSGIYVPGGADFAHTELGMFVPGGCSAAAHGKALALGPRSYTYHPLSPYGLSGT
eukprot:1589565-Rhodomonas_salina.1